MTCLLWPQNGCRFASMIHNSFKNSDLWFTETSDHQLTWKLDSRNRHILHSLDRTQLIHTCILLSFSQSLVIHDSRAEVQRFMIPKFLKQSRDSLMFCNYDSWLMIPPPTPTLKQNKVKCVSSNHKKQFYPYGSSEPLKTAEVAVVDVAVEAEFIVIEGNLGPGIARRETTTQLKVLSLSPNFCVNSMQKGNLFQKCNSYFKGLGKLKDFQLNIPIDPRVKPVVQSMHRLYFSLRCDYSNRGTWKKILSNPCKDFWKQKILKILGKRTNTFIDLRAVSWDVRLDQKVLKFSTVELLKLEFYWSLCQKNWESFVYRNRCDWIIFFQVPRFE